MCLYLWVCQAGVVGFEVVDDALACSRQGDAAHQKHKQHNVWEGGRQVHHLECTQGCGHDGTERQRRGGGGTSTLWHNKLGLQNDCGAQSVITLRGQMKEDSCSVSDYAANQGFVVFFDKRKSRWMIPNALIYCKIKVANPPEWWLCALKHAAIKELICLSETEAQRWLKSLHTPVKNGKLLSRKLKTIRIAHMIKCTPFDNW